MSAWAFFHRHAGLASPWCRVMILMALIPSTSILMMLSIGSEPQAVRHAGKGLAPLKEKRVGDRCRQLFWPVQARSVSISAICHGFIGIAKWYNVHQKSGQEQSNFCSGKTLSAPWENRIVACSIDFLDTSSYCHHIEIIQGHDHNSLFQQETYQWHKKK